MRRISLAFMLLFAALITGCTWFDKTEEQIPSRVRDIQRGDYQPNWISNPLKITLWSAWVNTTLSVTYDQLLNANGSYLVPAPCGSLTSNVSVLQWGDHISASGHRVETEQSYYAPAVQWLNGEWLKCRGTYKTVWRKIGGRWVMDEMQLICSYDVVWPPPPPPDPGVLSNWTPPNPVCMREQMPN